MNNVPLIDNATQRPELLAHVHAVDVSPDLAEKWLVHNTHNRGLKPNSIERFVADMESGEWQWNGGTICWSDDGVLLDGQNRLHAVVRSGVTVPMLVVGNLPHHVQRDIDTGVSRKLADVFTLNGEPNASALAALVRSCEQWESGVRRGIAANATVPISRCVAFLDEHPELRDMVAPARTAADKCHLPASILGLAWWVFERIDSEDADFFFARLEDGQGLFKGDPIFELRRTLEELNRSVRGERNRSYLLAITITAWNAYRNGETVGLYRWRPGGAKPEKFPEPA